MCLQLDQNNENLGPNNITEREINEEGIKFVSGATTNEGILSAIGHNFYDLPQYFCNVSQ